MPRTPEKRAKGSKKAKAKRTAKQKPTIVVSFRTDIPEQLKVRGILEFIDMSKQRTSKSSLKVSEACRVMTQCHTT